MLVDKIIKGRAPKSRIGCSLENKKNVSRICPKINGTKNA